MRKRHIKKNISRPSRRASPGAIEWQGALQSGAARVTVLGSKRLLVENHTGLIEFTANVIRLNSAGGAIAIEGKNLSISDMRRQQLIIHGQISRVLLPEEGGDT